MNSKCRRNWWIHGTLLRRKLDQHRRSLDTNLQLQYFFTSVRFEMRTLVFKSRCASVKSYLIR